MTCGGKLSFYDVADLYEINRKLEEIMEAEATKLYRLAWRAERHGCSRELINEIREEARLLHRVGGMRTEFILDPFRYWKYAFKCADRLDWGRNY